MTDPLRDHIRAALDYDVIIRDALATVPNSAINDLVERLAGALAPSDFDDLCDGDGCPACGQGPLEYRAGVLMCPDCGWTEEVSDV